MENITINELILILRRRKGLTQHQLGAAIFPDLLHPAIKIKKIENSEISVTDKDIGEIEKFFELPTGALKQVPAFDGSSNPEAFCFNPKLFKLFPELENYFRIINSILLLSEDDIDGLKKLIILAFNEAGTSVKKNNPNC